METNERIERIVRMASRFPAEIRQELARRISELEDKVPRDAYARFSELLLNAEAAVGCQMDGSRRAASVMIRRFVAYRMWKEGFSLMDISRTMRLNHATVITYVRNMQTCFDMPVYYAHELNLYMKFEDKARPMNKYGNHKVENAEGVFDSKGEWLRWCFLKDAERRGEISDLCRQVTFQLVPAMRYTETVRLKTKDKQVERTWTREVTYTADFVYRIDGATIVEDFKGMPNDRWQMKKALMAFVHGIYVREVKRPAEPIKPIKP